MLFERKIRFDAVSFNHPYDALVPIQNSGGFLHYVEYSPRNIDPGIADNHFRNSVSKIKLGGCSGVFKDGKVLRHFDWTYDDSAQFIVKMNADPSRNVMFTSIGFAFTTPILSRQLMPYLIGGAPHPYFDILPYTMVDGMNSAGIYVQSNVVPKDGAESVDINPTGQGCCIQMMLVRFLLDRLGNVADLKNVLDTLHLYSSDAAEGYGIHLMVADAKKTAIVEFENDHYQILTRIPIISNFRMNRGFKVVDARSGNYDPVWDTIEPHGQGVERWEIMSSFLKDPNMSFLDLRPKLYYSNAYSSPAYPWLTEISHGSQFTTYTAYDEHMNGPSSPYHGQYTQAMQEMSRKYENRSRSAKGLDRTWQTVHSCIYDIASLSGQFQIQEGQFGGNGWSFRL